MEYELKYLLHICGCVIRGDSPLAPQERLDLSRLFVLAKNSDIVQYCGYGLQNVIKSDTSHFSDDDQRYIAMMYAKAKQSAMSNMVIRENTISLMDELNADGFELAVYKGMAVAECYSQPYLRRSGDIDFYIDKKYERALYRWLERHGFEVSKRATFANHSKATSPDYGYLKMHTAIFADRLTDRWRHLAGSKMFSTPQKPFVVVEGQQGRFVTLDFTEHFIYIFLHFVKHHLALEGDLKMLCDINAYALHYRDEIAWDEVMNCLGKLGYERLLLCILVIGRLYMGIDVKVPVDDEAIDVGLLDDLAQLLAMVRENQTIRKDFKTVYWEKLFKDNNEGGRFRFSFFFKGKFFYYLRFIKKHSPKEFLSALRKKLVKDKKGDNNHGTRVEACLENFRNTGLL